MIDVGDDGHVTDVLLLVHDLTDLVNRKINHLGLVRLPLAKHKRKTLVSQSLAQLNLA